jgi:hypothetical protein
MATHVVVIIFIFRQHLSPIFQVLHRRLLSFQASLKNAESLDEMISLHNSQ